MPQNKDACRKDMLARRKGLTPQEAEARSREAQARLLRSSPWQEAGSVLLYAHHNNETGTDLLLQDAWQRGLQVLLPRCCRLQGHSGAEKLSGELELAAVSGPQELSPGAYGIAEPHPQSCPPLLGCQVDLALLPGVAFDRHGGRLGYGGGYYDRLLASGRLRGALLVGFAYQWQVVSRLPADPWDQPVQALCTDKELLWI